MFWRGSGGQADLDHETDTEYLTQHVHSLSRLILRHRYNMYTPQHTLGEGRGTVVNVGNLECTESNILNPLARTNNVRK